MSCRSDGGFVEPLPAGMCTGWTRRRGLTGESLSCGGGWTNVGMWVGGLRYRMFSEGCSGGFEVTGELFLLFLFFGGGEANISGSTGFSSVNVGFLSSCKWLKSNYANSLKLVFSSSYAGCFCLVCWFSCSFVLEACACFWGMVVRGCARRDLC